MRIMPVLASLSLLIILPAVSPAQQPAKRPDCSGTEYRAFDFWIGDWDVSVSGKVVGRNIVTREQDGCVIHEHWNGGAGDSGESFNFLDRNDQRWHQVWVSNSGNALNLSGTFAAGALALRGVTVSGADSTHHLLEFTPGADGTVRQLWRTSRDGGITWSSAFDGLYVKRR